jgi:hypothetical protein
MSTFWSAQPPIDGKRKRETQKKTERERERERDETRRDETRTERTKEEDGRICVPIFKLAVFEILHTPQNYEINFPPRGRRDRPENTHERKKKKEEKKKRRRTSSPASFFSLSLSLSLDYRERRALCV